MTKKVGSKLAAFRLSNQLSKLQNGFQLKPHHFTEPIKPASFENGSKSYIVPCYKMTLSYCNRGGSSLGMANFIKEKLVTIAKNNPETEIQVIHTPKRHPKITSHYLNGNSQEMLVKNMTPKEVGLAFQLLHNSAGNEERDFRKHMVISNNQSVRGIWSPFSVPKHQI